MSLAVVLTVLIVAGAGAIVRGTFFGPAAVTVYFTSATGIYTGDEVRVAGVEVGTVTGIEPAGGQARMKLSVERGVPIPADAKAVIVAAKPGLRALCPAGAGIRRSRTGAGRWCNDPGQPHRYPC